MESAGWRTEVSSPGTAGGVVLATSGNLGSEARSGGTVCLNTGDGLKLWMVIDVKSGPASVDPQVSDIAGALAGSMVRVRAVRTTGCGQGSCRRVPRQRWQKTLAGIASGAKANYPSIRRILGDSGALVMRHRRRRSFRFRQRDGHSGWYRSVIPPCRQPSLHRNPTLRWCGCWGV